MSELTEKIPEISYSFEKPDSSALYLVKTSWRLDAENIIDEDSRFVMGPSYSNTDYIPLPMEVFQNSLNELAKRGALQINPENLFESIDYNPLDVPENLAYVMDSSGVFVRIRKDDKGVHTMKMIGKRNSLVGLLSNTGLPSPFGEYPYKLIFRDESGASGKIKAFL